MKLNHTINHLWYFALLLLNIYTEESEWFFVVMFFVVSNQTGYTVISNSFSVDSRLILEEDNDPKQTVRVRKENRLEKKRKKMFFYKKMTSI